jgi:sporulation protein YlmC with PRC-barrel domain
LRSTRQVTGYHILATDGGIGHVGDYVVDDETWALQYLVVDTGKWLPGRKVLISPTWIKSVNWADTSVFLDHSREEVKISPDFDPLKPSGKSNE